MAYNRFDRSYYNSGEYYGDASYSYPKSKRRYKKSFYAENEYEYYENTGYSGYSSYKSAETASKGFRKTRPNNSFKEPYNMYQEKPVLRQATSYNQSNIDKL